ncbi:hypothetical protein M1N44_00675 [Dehalococcoidia bacterium]|nr:hypothetical protein [Dehalococcoidia bacterium]
MLWLPGYRGVFALRIEPITFAVPRGFISTAEKQGKNMLEYLHKTFLSATGRSGIHGRYFVI